MILTDHKPLIYAFLQRSDRASMRQQRQLDFIGQHSTDIQYVSGEANQIADAFSRLEAIDMPVIVTTEEIVEEQKADPESKKLLD